MIGATRISHKADQFTESVIREMTRRRVGLQWPAAVDFAHRVRFSYPKRLATIGRGLARLESLRARAAATAAGPA